MHQYVEIKHTLLSSESKENTQEKLFLNKWKWKCNIPKLIGSERNAKREVYSCKFIYIYFKSLHINNLALYLKGQNIRTN